MSRKTDMVQDRHWHLDRKVPLALIVTIAIQTGAVIWWGSSLNERVNQLEARAVSAAPQAERITRIEGKIENVEQGIQRIERALERQLPK